MNKFILKIELGNDAMQNQADVAHALMTVATKIRKTGSIEGAIFDDNGNKVGTYQVVYED